MTNAFRLAVLLAAVAAPVMSQESGSVRFVGSLSLRESLDGFGGLSGLELSDDGRAFWVVSDEGTLFSGNIVRQEDDAIAGIADLSGHLLRYPGGEPVRGYRNDAEGLAMGADGTLFISFEGEHRIWSYPGIDPRTWDGGGVVPVTPHPEFAKLQNNSSLETLAVAPDGALLAIPERSGVLNRPFPVYRFLDGEWIADASIPRRPPYLAVGGDFGPDGRFYLLERHLRGVFGFQTRVRRFDYGPDGFGNEVTLIETNAARHDNLEGIAVWRDRDGDIRLTMVSDDNFRGFQRSEFVEYVVKE